MGGFAERQERAGQDDEGSQARAEATTIQVVGVVERTMATVAVGTIVVGAGKANFAIDGQEGAFEVVVERGIAVAPGAHTTGPYVALFFRPCRPV